MKVAVLMIGHIKNSLELNNYIRLNALFNELNCDLFIFTSKYYTFRGANINKFLIKPEVNVEKFYNVYKKFIKKIIVEEYEDPKLSKILFDMLKSFRNRHNYVLSKNKKLKKKTISPVYSKLLITNYIKNLYAKNNNITYDYVLVLRPENIMKEIKISGIKKIIKNSIINNIVYGSEWYTMGPNNLINTYSEKLLHYYKYHIKSKSNDHMVQNKLILKIINKADYIPNGKIFQVSTPYNAYHYVGINYYNTDKININDVYKNTTKMFHRTFFVKDYKKENLKSSFYKNYLKFDDSFYEQFKKDYSILF